MPRCPLHLTRQKFMPQFTPKFVCFALFIGLSSVLSLIARPTSDRPNVVLIMADDLGFECLGAYGGVSYATPHLDRMAEQGVLFTDAHAVPLCTPTRVSLMTGKYNFRNWLAFGILDPHAKTFGHWMQDAGYKTCIVGKWQLHSYNPMDYQPEWRSKGMRAEDAGFDEYALFHTGHDEDKGSRYPDPVIDVNGKLLKNNQGLYGPDFSVDYMNDFMERHKDEPFFVYYPMALVHDPIQPTPDSPEWKTDRFENNRKFFGDMVEYMDKLVGKILTKIDSLGIAENTLVLFYGDNGTVRGIPTKMADGTTIIGGKGDPNIYGSHVPLVVWWPGMAKAGHVVEDLVDSNDFIPTMFEAAGVPLPADEIFDGISFLPQVKGKVGTPREWVFMHYNPLPGDRKERFRKWRWAFDKRWKLSEETGYLFDYTVDPLETSPIMAGEGSDAAEAARIKLQAVIDSMPDQES
jgi:arylsulfatase A